MSRKTYTIRINEDLPTGINLWYREKGGNTYDAHLAIAENKGGQPAPVFKLSGPPFFHVYPNHCTVINEKLL
jgi:hypothetical protein